MLRNIEMGFLRCRMLNQTIKIGTTTAYSRSAASSLNLVLPGRRSR